MPSLIYVLALAVFAQGTSEFMLAGILSPLAYDVGVTPAAAGSLTSAFALGMVIGAPLMAVLARHWAPERALVWFLTIFALTHVAGALVDSFALLFVTRVLAAFANAGFLAVVLSLAGRVVPAPLVPRAIAVLLGGTTLATVAGAPLGALLAGALGWRATFWAVALLCLPALAWLPRVRAAGREAASGVDVGAEFASLSEPRLAGTIAVAVLVNAATFGTLTFLEVAGSGAGLPHALGPVLLMAFGLGAFVGVGAAGRFGAARPRRWIVATVSLLPLVWVATALVAGSWTGLLPMGFVAGAASFAAGAALISRIVTVAIAAPTLGGAFATVALNVGAFAGPLVSGAVLGWQGVVLVPWVAVAFTAMAVLLLPLALKAPQRP